MLPRMWSGDQWHQPHLDLVRDAGPSALPGPPELEPAFQREPVHAHCSDKTMLVGPVLLPDTNAKQCPGLPRCQTREGGPSSLFSAASLPASLPLQLAGQQHGRGGHAHGVGGVCSAQQGASVTRPTKTLSMWTPRWMGQLVLFCIADDPLLRHTQWPHHGPFEVLHYPGLTGNGADAPVESGESSQKEAGKAAGCAVFLSATCGSGVEHTRPGEGPACHRVREETRWGGNGRGWRGAWKPRAG